MSFSGVLTTASFDVSPATYALRVATATCSDSITGLSELATHSNNNATMHDIHLNLQNSIFIAMCKCTVLFSNTLLKSKEICCTIIYFAPSCSSVHIETHVRKLLLAIYTLLSIISQSGTSDLSTD